MQTASKDSVENLSDLALVIAMYVQNVLSASFVTFIADAWFNQFHPEEQQKRFRTNPANNIIYTGLKALEEQGIVGVYETLKDEHGLNPTTATIRRKGDLRLHRHAISHPMTVEWKDQKMSLFAEAQRDGYDWRPALVWDLQRSINDELRKHGRQIHVDGVSVTFDMAVSLHAILNLSRIPHYEIPTAELLFDYMQCEVTKYQAMLEKHPDGARDPKAEKARAESQRKRRDEWATQATS